MSPSSRLPMCQDITCIYNQDWGCIHCENPGMVYAGFCKVSYSLFLDENANALMDKVKARLRHQKEDSLKAYEDVGLFKKKGGNPCPNSKVNLS